MDSLGFWSKAASGVGNRGRGVNESVMLTYFDFGKYSGRRITDAPESYLRWCLDSCQCLTPELRRSIQAVLQASDGNAGDGNPGVAMAIRDAVRRWHREMVMRFHPDREGNHQAMVAVNAGYERLTEILGDVFEQVR